MVSVNLFCHEFVVAVSSVACVVGLFLLNHQEAQRNDFEETEETLLKMSFSYWLVYCAAFGVEKIVVPNWEALSMSLKITTTLSYFLTFSCILSLPLYKFAVHHIEE